MPQFFFQCPDVRHMFGTFLKQTSISWFAAFFLFRASSVNMIALRHTNQCLATRHSWDWIQREEYSKEERQELEFGRICEYANNSTDEKFRFNHDFEWFHGLKISCLRLKWLMHNSHIWQGRNTMAANVQTQRFYGGAIGDVHTSTTAFLLLHHVVPMVFGLLFPYGMTWCQAPAVLPNLGVDVHGEDSLASSGAGLKDLHSLCTSNVKMPIVTPLFCIVPTFRSQ